MANIYGALLGDLVQSQQNAAMQYQRDLAQQQAIWNDSKIQNYGYMLINPETFNASTLPGLKNISNCKFVPITQEEVDMAEAWYEVNKIAPGVKDER
jgi:hypothetical protein